MSPRGKTIAVGDTLRIVLSATDSSGRPGTGTVQWSVLNPLSFDVDSTVGALSNVSNTGADFVAKGPGAAMPIAWVGTISAPTAFDSMTVRDTAPDTGGGAEPTPSGQILFDIRTSLQQAQSDSEMFALFPFGHRGEIHLSTDVDGNGTHALRYDWGTGAAGTVGTENDATVETQAFNVSGKLCTSWYNWLGRTATGGGVGTVGYYQLANLSNAHEKEMLWKRAAGDDRIYFVWRPGEAKYSIDGLNSNSGALSMDPLRQVARLQRWTVCHSPGNPGHSDTWYNGTLVGSTDWNAGLSGWTSIQVKATMRGPAQEESEYMWGLVVWQP